MAGSLNKELYYYINDNVLYYKEYQNKYYLKKKIKELLPNKSDDFIYRAIEYANRNISPSKRKKEYIKLLLEKLNKFNIDDYQI